MRYRVWKICKTKALPSVWILKSLRFVFLYLLKIMLSTQLILALVQTQKAHSQTGNRNLIYVTLPQLSGAAVGTLWRSLSTKRCYARLYQSVVQLPEPVGGQRYFVFRQLDYLGLSYINFPPKLQVCFSHPEVGIKIVSSLSKHRDQTASIEPWVKLWAVFFVAPVMPRQAKSWIVTFLSHCGEFYIKPPDH